tara:strand:+ start:3288 stop:3704 length:417 start_codon:yes stop_codon:yes gene_type:complete
MSAPIVNQNNGNNGNNGTGIVQGTMDKAENVASNITGSVKDAAGKVTSWFSGLFSGNKASTQPGQVTNASTQNQQLTTTTGGRKKTKRYRKGSRSKTRRGRKDFVTHKGSKKYNRRGHRQSRNSRGRKGKPYTHKKKH